MLFSSLQGRNECKVQSPYPLNQNFRKTFRKTVVPSPPLFHPLTQFSKIFSRKKRHGISIRIISQNTVGQIPFPRKRFCFLTPPVYVEHVPEVPEGNPNSGPQAIPKAFPPLSSSLLQLTQGHRQKTPDSKASCACSTLHEQTSTAQLQHEHRPYEGQSSMRA